MEKHDITQKDFNDNFEQAAAIFAASGAEITKPIMRLMSPLLSGKQNISEHRASLKAELSGMQE
jgi:hypothetical protein